MGFKRWLDEVVGQTGLFHRDSVDNPVPTGEQYPLPTTRAAVTKSVTIAAGQTVSTAVDTAGAVALALVCLTATPDFTASYKVASSEAGPYYDLWTSPNIPPGSRLDVLILPGRAQSLSDRWEYLTPWRFVKLEAGIAVATPRVIEVHMK